MNVTKLYISTFSASPAAEVTHSTNIIIADIYYVTTALCVSQVMDSFFFRWKELQLLTS